jgi:copper resistance protein B
MNNVMKIRQPGDDLLKLAIAFAKSTGVIACFLNFAVASEKADPVHELHHVPLPGHHQPDPQNHHHREPTQHSGHLKNDSRNGTGTNNPPIANNPHSQDFSHLSKPEMGEHQRIGALIADRLEMVNARNDFSMTYDWQAWYGGDYNKALVRAEGEIDEGRFKNARNELLWAHALTAYWDSQLGVRYDSGQGSDRAWGAFGVQGYAPYWLYVEATAYVGEDARTAFRLELEYDLRITQMLILQPRIEANFYARRDDSRFISSGLSNLEAGLRLRYEIAREFAPYVGIEWAGTFGSAAEMLRSQGYQPEEGRILAGIHFWY